MGSWGKPGRCQPLFPPLFLLPPAPPSPRGHTSHLTSLPPLFWHVRYRLLLLLISLEPSPLVYFWAFAPRLPSARTPRAFLRSPTGSLTRRPDGCLSAFPSPPPSSTHLVCRILLRHFPPLSDSPFAPPYLFLTTTTYPRPLLLFGSTIIVVVSPPFVVLSPPFDLFLGGYNQFLHSWFYVPPFLLAASCWSDVFWRLSGLPSCFFVIASWVRNHSSLGMNH